MRDVSVQADEVMLQFGWYAAQSAGQEHEVVHLIADEIVSLRKESTALRSLILRIMDAMNSGRVGSDRVLSDDFPAEITKMREALAAATRVEDGYRIANRFNVIGASSFGTAAQAASWLRQLDDESPNQAPHRVVRVALVDEGVPESNFGNPPAAAGREVTEAEEP